MIHVICLIKLLLVSGIIICIVEMISVIERYNILNTHNLNEELNKLKQDNSVLASLDILLIKMIIYYRND